MYNREDKDHYIESQLQKAAKYDNASLLREATELNRLCEEEKANNPEEAEKRQKESDLGFELLMARLNAEGKTPVDENEYNQKNRRERHPDRRKRLSRKVILVAAAMGVLVIGGSISSAARNGYNYVVYPQDRKENTLVRYNTNIEQKQDQLDKAYDRIECELEIPVLILSYIPKNMKFSELESTGNSAIIKFVYKGKRIYLKEDKLSEKNAFSLLVSDRNAEQKIRNDWIDSDLYIEENLLKNGVIEYSVSIQGEEALYYLSGVMEREEFVKIAENLVYR